VHTVAVDTGGDPIVAGRQRRAVLAGPVLAFLVHPGVGLETPHVVEI
jgi:hypothetical protein